MVVLLFLLSRVQGRGAVVSQQLGQLKDDVVCLGLFLDLEVSLTFNGPTLPAQLKHRTTGHTDGFFLLWMYDDITL